MHGDLRWYLSRLRAMSLPEAAHRSYRAARYPLEQLRMRAGVYARPSIAMRTHFVQWRGPEPFYFDRALVTVPVSPELRMEAEEICAGRRRVLGLGWIEFPPHGWHLEPQACETWPRVDAGRVARVAPPHLDARLTWELNRGHAWVVLARVYAATGEPRFRDHLVRELASWREHNPVGHGINWTSAMEAAIRIHSLAWVAGFLRGAPDGVLAELAAMIYEHATFVDEHRSAFSSANNHLIVELTGLIVAALAVGGELRRLHAPALTQLASELDRQVFADGVDVEMASHYHAFVLEALLLVAYLERAHARPARHLETVIWRMADHLAAIRCEDGSLLQQGDNDDGCIGAFMRTRHADQLLAAAAALGVPRDTGSPTTLEGAFWLAGTTREPRRPRMPARSRRFGNAGQIVLRSARLHATLDAGPFGFGSLAAHAHCDALAVAIAIDGRRVVVDRGTYRYNGDRQERDRYRLTAAHNTVQVGTLEQAVPAGPFLWARQPTVTIHRCELMDDGDLVQASHDGFAGWTHRRTLVHHHGVLVIIDELEGSGPAERIVGRCHLAPELAITRRSHRSVEVAHGSPLAWLVSNARSTRIVVSPHSDVYASRTTAPTIELVSTTSRGLVTALAPADADREASLERLATFAAAHGVRLCVRDLWIDAPLSPPGEV